MKDFFISYNGQDQAWAEWIAWTLEEVGYSTVIQAWDFRPGGNFVLEMHKAAQGTQRTLAVLSQHYLAAEYTQPEWADALRRDPQGAQRTLLPVRIDDCRPPGLLTSVIYVDLHGLAQDVARQRLLAALADRGKPTDPPAFPGAASTTAASTPPPATRGGATAVDPSAPPNAASASRSVNVGGNAGGNIIITGDGNVIHLPPGGAPFPGVAASASLDNSAVAIWREKLEFLRQQEAISSDPAQKFQLKKQIEEALARISELSQ